MSSPENQSQNGSFVDKARRILIAASAVLLIGGTAGCTPAEGQEKTTKPETSSVDDSTTERTTTPTETTTAPTTETTTNLTTTTRPVETTARPTTTKATTEKSTTTKLPEKTTEKITKPVVKTTEKVTKPVETTNYLEGVDPEKKEFINKLLNLYDRCGQDYFSDEMKNYVTKKQIIEYGKTGQGLTVINHENGTPAIALINCNDDVKNAFNDTVSEMNNYDSSYLRHLTDNGTVAFFVNRFDSSRGSTFTFNKDGLIVWNLNPEKEIGAFALKVPILTESFGIKMYKLGGDYAKYVGYIKQELSSRCWWNLYKKNNEQFCYDMSKGEYMVSKLTYGPQYAPLTYKDTKIQALIGSAIKLVSLFGGSESEISKSIKDRPDWTS